MSNDNKLETSKGPDEDSKQAAATGEEVAENGLWKSKRLSDNGLIGYYE